MRGRHDPDPTARPTTASQPARSAPSTEPEQNAPSTSFEEGLERLTRIVDQLEAGDLGLVESIDAYEQGIVLIRQLHSQLSACEQRVELLAAIDPASGAESTPRNTPEAPQASARPPRADRPGPGTSGRSGRTRRLPGMDDSPPGV